MATIEELKEKIRVLQQAGLSYDAELKQLMALQGEAGKKLMAEPTLVSEAKRLGAVVTEVTFEDVVDREAFLSSAGFYPPSSGGVWKSTLTEVTSPASGKNQKWFIVETNDERLKKQGKGVLVCDLGKGSFKLQQTLSNLGIEYDLVENRVRYTVSIPTPCESEWGERSDKKGVLGVQSLYALGQAPEAVL